MTQPDPPTRLTTYIPKEYFYQADKSLEQALIEGRQWLGQVQEALDAIPDHRWHEPVAVGRWSPAEYGDHLARTTWSWVRRLQDYRDGKPPENLGFGAIYPDGRAVMHVGTEPSPGRSRPELRSDLEAAHTALEALLQVFSHEGRLDEACHPHQYFGMLSARETAQLPTHHYSRHLEVLRAQTRTS